MAELGVRFADAPETTAQRSHGASGSPRERLLAGLPVAERRLQLAGISTAVLEGGDGPPLVLLHGPGEYAAKWLNVIPDLVATHRVIAPDLPAHGASHSTSGALDRARVFAWLDELIQRTCSTRPALVGHIIGGAIAARYAGERGERLSALVLVDALGLAPFRPAPDFGQALAAFIAEPTEQAHDHLWSRCAFDLDALRERMGERWQHLKAYNLDRARAPDLRAAQQALMAQFGMPGIAPPDLARIAVPTTLIWGRHDLATPLAVAQSAGTRYAWPLHVIEDAADDPPIEQPQAFLRALRAALDTSRGDAPATSSVRTAWDRIAPGYDRATTPTHLGLSGESLRRAGLQQGMRFLDVAAGSGALSIPAARLGAQVLATDRSPVMLECLATRARTEGLDIETQVMDGQALKLADDSFDLAASQFGVMLFPDMPRGVREMARVVKRGGRVLINAFGDPRKVEFLGFLVGAVKSVRPDFDGPPMDPPLLEFQLADPARLRHELAAAGLHDVRVETIDEVMEFTDGAALWDWLVSSNPVVEIMLGSLDLTPDETSTIQQTLEAMVRRRAGSSAVAKLTHPINIGICTK